jgi:small subunit ribosomal protein S10|tara:strand:- start:169 stop:492 length:324 start_codon:yes stop_codon:yes gene_type:complete
MSSLENQVKTQVKLESFDHKLLTIACKRLIDGIISINGQAKGPIALPTKKRIYCVLRSPHVDKKSREHFEIKIHKRLLEIYTPQNVDNIADSFLKIAIPPGVSIKLS